MNPGPAPKPPTDRPRLNLTPSVSHLPGSVSGLSLQSNGSQTSLIRSHTQPTGGAFAVVKEGPAKVKEEGSFLRSLVWNDRWLILREYQLDFMKNQQSPKVSNTIQLREITNITRSEEHPLSFEITRTTSAVNGASPPREGPQKVIVCKVEADEDVYSWIDSIYQRCPSMGGVSNPTNFTHRVHVGYDPVSGGFVGLPAEWEKLLTASAITKEDYQKNPEAVYEVLNFYTETLMKRADEPAAYPSLTPTPGVEAQNRQLGYPTTGSSIAPPRPPPPGQQFSRTESFQSSRPDAAQQQAERDAQARREEERRRMEEESRRRREEQERERQRREQQEYNASLPKSRPPMAQQELGGYGGGGSQQQDQRSQYQAARTAPSAPPAQRPTPPQQQSSQQTSQLPLRQQNYTAQRQAPSAPAAAAAKPNGSSAYPQSQQPGAQPAQMSSSSVPRPAQNATAPKYATANTGANGAPLTRAPPSGSSAPAQQRAPAAQGTSTSTPKPLNVQSKPQPQPPAGQTAAQSDAIKKAEQALTRKDDGGGSTRKEQRMSSMTEAEVMAKLREVVSKERPLDSYNKQKKIGQGASGSVYVARIRENATSAMARKILREQGPKAQVAIKQMDLRNQPRKELIVNEIIVMKESRHDNIVNFLDAFLQEESSELWVVMEFMEGGALTDVIDNNPTIREDQISTVCLEVSTSVLLS